MADEPKNEGTFYCKCLWTGTLSFTPEEVEALEGEIRKHMGPCPECGQNSLMLAQESAPGHEYAPPWGKYAAHTEDQVDDLLDRMEAAAGEEKPNDG